ncbi:hypothetical protein JKP88DRAFT_275828 [Tribonema minus]|uniref:Uncharacterized protein n=1 Tax=Tribonema minus TaxID=303371 RepID=A0A836CKC7_9STRA|nr:hypothetical protein JKP88DRAFT_275828 [Tribonema minus]
MRPQLRKRPAPHACPRRDDGDDGDDGDGDRDDDAPPADAAVCVTFACVAGEQKRARIALAEARLSSTAPAIAGRDFRRLLAEAGRAVARGTLSLPSDRRPGPPRDAAEAALRRSLAVRVREVLADLPYRGRWTAAAREPAFVADAAAALPSVASRTYVRALSGASPLPDSVLCYVASFLDPLSHADVLGRCAGVVCDAVEPLPPALKTAPPPPNGRRRRAPPRPSSSRDPSERAPPRRFVWTFPGDSGAGGACTSLCPPGCDHRLLRIDVGPSESLCHRFRAPVGAHVEVAGVVGAAGEALESLRPGLWDRCLGGDRGDLWTPASPHALAVAVPLIDSARLFVAEPGGAGLRPWLSTSRVVLMRPRPRSSRGVVGEAELLARAKASREALAAVLERVSTPEGLREGRCEAAERALASWKAPATRREELVAALFCWARGNVRDPLRVALFGAAARPNERIWRAASDAMACDREAAKAWSREVGELDDPAEVLRRCAPAAAAETAASSPDSPTRFLTVATAGDCGRFRWRPEFRDELEDARAAVRRAKARCRRCARA